MKIIKNKVLNLLLVAAMIAGSLSGCSSDPDQSLQTAAKETAEANEAADAGETEADGSYIDTLVEKLSLPEVGDVISGFTVKKITDYPQRNGLLIEMEYEKTGTPLLFLANEDEDKAFNAAYLTRANNNKGIPHIFEHVTLSGSTEYPGSSMWDAISGGTYNTYMNASTFTETTSYMFSSLSDEQLIAIARFYLSGLSDPLALKDSHPLGREAYRYQLYDENDDINVTGAVFSEMESSNSDITRGTYQAILANLYPGSYMSYNAAGVRDDIMTVTLEELQTYYDTYYHPSNMIISLYGNVDYVPFLEFLDTEFLSKYDKKEVNIDDINYQPWRGYKEAVIDFPVEEGSEVKDQSEVVYVMTLPDISGYDFALLESIAEIMCKDGSSLVKRIESEYPSCEIEEFYDRDLDVPFFGFGLTNANEGDEKTFRNIINEEFEKVVENGFDKDILDAFANDKEAEILINADAHGGTEELGDICNYWATHGKSMDAYFEYLEGQQSLGKANEEGRLQEVITDYILNPQTSISLAVVPKPGLYEEKWEEHMQILRDMKASMSDEEIQELIDSTLEFDEWSNQDQENSDVSAFAAVNVEDLDVSFEKPEIIQSQEGNVRIYSYDLGDVGYVASGIMLSADSVPADRIFDFNLASALLGNLSTENYSDTQLSTCMDRDSYDFSHNAYLYHDEKTGEPHMTWLYNYLALSRNADTGIEYFDEIINSTDFSDIDRIKYLINTEYITVKNELEDNTLGLIKAYDLAMEDDNYKLDYYKTGFEYLAYLKELTQMSDEEIEDKMADIEDVIDLVKNQNDAILVLYGDGKDLQACKDGMLGVLSGFSDEKLATTDFAGDLPKVEKISKLAIVTNDSSLYNGVISGLATEVRPFNGVSGTVSRFVLSNIVYPCFRYDLGAYGGYNYYSSDNLIMYVLSYRDPQVNKTFEFIDSLPEKISNYDVIEEDIESAKLKVYSDYAYPENKSSLVIREIYRKIQNSTSYVDFINDTLEEIKTVTPQDVFDNVDAYRTMVDEGLKFSYGSGSKIKEAGGYDLIIEDLVK